MDAHDFFLALTNQMPLTWDHETAIVTKRFPFGAKTAGHTGNYYSSPIEEERMFCDHCQSLNHLTAS